MAVITRALFPKAQRPGLDALWGLNYKDHPKLYEQLFETLPMDMNYIEDLQVNGFGFVPVKNEGSAITFDSMSQGYSYKYRYKTYAMGFIVSYEEIQDNLYMRANQRTKALARSARITKELVAHSVFNNGFDTGTTYGDGQPAFSLSHPTLAGNQQNKLTIAANLSEKALEDLCILAKKATDSRGIDLALQTKKLVVPVDLEFEANRILESELQNNTANNAINALKATGRFPEGIVASPYLSSAKAYFVETDCPDSFKFFQRNEAEFGEYQDNDTFNTKFFYRESYVPGISDWRGYYASQGV